MSKKLLFILIFNLFILHSFAIKTDSIDSINVNKVTQVELTKPIETEFSVLNLYNYIKSKGVDDPSYIISQFVLESGNFHSVLFINSNNICGMKTAKKRKVKSNVIGRTKSGYARYKNWIYSVDDFFLWMERHSLNPANSNYIYKLKQKHYNSSSNYANLILHTRKVVMKKYSTIF